MRILNIGDYFIIRLDDGDGIKYQVTNNIITPFKLIKTLSEVEVDEHEE